MLGAVSRCFDAAPFSKYNKAVLGSIIHAKWD